VITNARNFIGQSFIRNRLTGFIRQRTRLSVKKTGKKQCLQCQKQKNTPHNITSNQKKSNAKRETKRQQSTKRAGSLTYPISPVKYLPEIFLFLVQKNIFDTILYVV
jgi:hypothetical protein